MIRINNNRGFGFMGVIIIVAIVAVIGGGTYYSAKKAAKVAIDANVQATSSADTTVGTSTAGVSTNASAGISIGSSSSGSIRALLNAGKDLTCTVSYSTSTAKGIMKTEGTVFISGNSMRGDFMMTGGAASDAHMIREGDTVVAWSGKQGVKMSMANMDGTNTSANTSSQIDLDQNVSYRCSDWRKDISKFIVPYDIKIYDVSNVMMEAAGKVQLPR